MVKTIKTVRQNLFKDSRFVPIMQEYVAFTKRGLDAGAGIDVHLLHERARQHLILKGLITEKTILPIKVIDNRKRRGR